MKRLLTLVLTIVLANVAIQTKAATPEVEKKAKAEVAKMTQQLSLTKEQESKLLPIAIESITQREAIKATKDTEANKRTAVAKLKRDIDSKVKTVLTAEQFTKWKATQQNAKATR